MGSMDVDVTLQCSVDMICLGEREGIGEQIRNWVNQSGVSYTRKMYQMALGSHNE